jgi:hypothetical protein
LGDTEPLRTVFTGAHGLVSAAWLLRVHYIEEFQPPEPAGDPGDPPMKRLVDSRLVTEYSGVWHNKQCTFVGLVTLFILQKSQQITLIASVESPLKKHKDGRFLYL